MVMRCAAPAGAAEADIRNALKNHIRAAELDLGPDPEPAPAPAPEPAPAAVRACSGRGVDGGCLVCASSVWHTRDGRVGTHMGGLGTERSEWRQGGRFTSG